MRLTLLIFIHPFSAISGWLNGIGAVALYQSLGFVEYGLNPRGFNSRTTGYQELIDMRLELEKGEACPLSH